MKQDGMTFPEMKLVDISGVRKLKKLVNIISDEVPFELDSTKLARSLEATRETVVQYIHHLGKSKGDFKVNGKYTFEIGGPDKGFAQIAGVENSFVFADCIEMPSGRKLPLWMLGFIY